MAHLIPKFIILINVSCLRTVLKGKRICFKKRFFFNHFEINKNFRINIKRYLSNF